MIERQQQCLAEQLKDTYNPQHQSQLLQAHISLQRPHPLYRKYRLSDCGPILLHSTVKTVLNCCILDFIWTKYYYFDSLMISLPLRPKRQQMGILAWNQSTTKKSCGIWRTFSLAQTASFNCLGDCVLLLCQSQS